MSVNLEVLHVPDCPNLAPLLDRLRRVTDLPVTTHEITTDAEAAAHGMTGSPTLLINGTDPFAEPGRCDCGVSCRIYRDENGQPIAAPTVAQLREVLTAAAPATEQTSAVVPGPAGVAGPPCEPGSEPARPGEVLSAWRTQALQLDPVEKAVQQAILRSFATTGHPPAASELDPITAGSGRTTTEVLAALHYLDAIRLTGDGQIAVAYPFSAHPTKHRVRISDRVEVHAMCAIDALGISAMLDTDTRIDSLDPTTGHSVSVSITAGAATWDPPAAVVFVGADAGGGPSADCCCDYLNFFTDSAAARRWTAAHPHVPGQILNQAEAETLGARLFGSLLTTG